MSSPEQATPDASSADDLAALRSDFLSALGWMALGIAILIGSVMMDRLEKQDINPYTIPGLLPGLLGIAMTILGALLAARSWRPHLLSRAGTGAANHGAERKRLVLVLGLCLTFGVVLVGHGLPFWLAAGIFVGCLPGLSATLCIALLTTLTIKLAANDAILILICSYVGTLYGGSRTAILLNIPGTAANAASCADGHALALRGEAGRAIGIATSGAFSGTLFGVLCLAAVTPLLAEV